MHIILCTMYAIHIIISAVESKIQYHIIRLQDRVIFFQNNPKKLDPSYKMDRNLWVCLGRVKLVLQQNCIGVMDM